MMQDDEGESYSGCGRRSQTVHASGCATGGCATGGCSAGTGDGGCGGGDGG